MNIQKSQNISKMISLLAKADKRSQQQIADESEVLVSQLNKYLNGKIDPRASTLINILNTLGFDLEDQIKRKTQAVTDLAEDKIETKEDVLLYCYRNLDPLAQETILSHVAAISKLNGKSKKMPLAAKSILKDSSRHV